MPFKFTDRPSPRHRRDVKQGTEQISQQHHSLCGHPRAGQATGHTHNQQLQQRSHWSGAATNHQGACRCEDLRRVLVGSNQDHTWSMQLHTVCAQQWEVQYRGCRRLGCWFVGWVGMTYFFFLSFREIINILFNFYDYLVQSFGFTRHF